MEYNLNMGVGRTSLTLKDSSCLLGIHSSGEGEVSTVSAGHGQGWGHFLGIRMVKEWFVGLVWGSVHWLGWEYTGNILGILACLSVKGSGGVTLPGRGTRGSALGGEQPKDDLGGLQPQ